MQAKSISLCMIVKDEELVLENCLASVKDLVTEIIIVDTGSTDNTKEIAKKYDAKIYDIPWENDFSKARNHSLLQSSCDWILLLDADEVLELKDITKFQTLMDDDNYDGYHFTIYNYLHDRDTSEYTTHYAFRFLRNTGEYQFTGNIHEQIDKINGPLDASRFTIAGITLYHYGYISSIVKSKNKRERNMPLLKKALEEYPDSPFFLFNMGNEYMADMEYMVALNYYEKAMEFITLDQAYTPHLYYRMILCYIELKDYSKGLNLANKALLLFPECTDIEYCKATIYFKTYSHLLAVKSLNRCIEMGDPPSNLKFLNDCATTRSYTLLGDIYYLQNDYDSSLGMYNLLYERTKNPGLLYKIAPLLNLIYEDKNEVSNMLWQYLSLHNPHNIIYITKLLLQEKLFEHAQENLNALEIHRQYDIEYLFLNAKLNFYKGNYKRTQRQLRALFVKDITHTVLGNLYEPCLILNFLTHLYTNDDMNNLEIDLQKNNLFEEELILQMIEEILLSGDISILDRIMILLSHMRSQDIYLQVAKLYMKYNYKTMAIETIEQSIKIYSLIDRECAYWLSRNLDI